MEACLRLQFCFFFFSFFGLRQSWVLWKNHVSSHCLTSDPSGTWSHSRGGISNDSPLPRTNAVKNENYLLCEINFSLIVDMHLHGKGLHEWWKFYFSVLYNLSIKTSLKFWQVTVHNNVQMGTFSMFGYTCHLNCHQKVTGCCQNLIVTEMPF